MAGEEEEEEKDSFRQQEPTAAGGSAVLQRMCLNSSRTTWQPISYTHLMENIHAEEEMD